MAALTGISECVSICVNMDHYIEYIYEHFNTKYNISFIFFFPPPQFWKNYVHETINKKQ